MSGGSSHTSRRYSLHLVWLHWGCTLLIIFHLINTYTQKFLTDQKITLFLMELHKTTGFVIFSLMIYRLLVRLREKEVLKNGHPVWQNMLARLIHGSFYVLLIASPLVGWLYASSIGVEMRLFWLFVLPSLVSPDLALAALLLEIHKYMGVTLIAFLALHITAACYNKYRYDHHIFNWQTLKTLKPQFFSYTPMWLRLSFVAIVAMSGALSIGYFSLSGLQSTRGGYTETFRSVMLLRMAHANWENMKGQFAGQKKLSEKEYAQKFRMIKGDLQKSLAVIQQDPILTTVQLATLVLDDFSSLALARIRQNQPVFGLGLEKTADEISLEFEKIAEYSTDLIFEASKSFEAETARKYDNIVLLLVGVTCLSVLIVICVARVSSGEIDQVKYFAAQIMAGNLNQEVRIRGVSETAGLMRILNDMRLNLRQQFLWMQDLGHENRRKELRRPLIEVISISFKEETHPTHTIDVSRSGLCIRAVSGLEYNLNVIIHYSDGSQTEGKIAWVRGDKAGIQLYQPLPQEALFPVFEGSQRLRGES